MIGRRGWLKGLLVMTFPGLGGQQPPPQNAAPAGQLTPGVTPGVTGQVIARRVIIVGANGEFLVYNPAIAAGDLVVSIAGEAGTGLAGDTVQPGVVSYDSSGDYAQLFGARLNLLASAGVTPSSLAADPGELIISSGQSTSGFDPQSQIVMFDEQASGSPNGIIELLAGNLKIGTSSSQPVPYPSTGITTVAEVVAALKLVGIFE